MGEVFVVDSQAPVNLVPPKQQIRGNYVLYTLLGLALFGVFVEGVLIYQLYQRISIQNLPESLTSRQIGENTIQDDTYAEEILNTNSDTKPAAFLHYNHSSKSVMNVMHWNYQGFPAFVNGFNCTSDSLIIPKDGFYFLFSKVSFRNNCKFKHEVKFKTALYNNVPLVLMMDSRYNAVEQTKCHDKNLQCSSYLGGVWKLHKNDKVYVSVSDRSHVVEGLHENFFGGYMI